MNLETTSPAPRLRTCRACGRKFEYPVRGSDATRHHCADCAELPADTRRALERLSTRIAQLENTLRRLQKQPPIQNQFPP